MQSDREDAFTPLNFNDYVNDTESLHMFNPDSPSAGQMSIDPASVFLNNEFAPSPVLNNHQPAFSSPSRYLRSPFEDVKQDQAPFGQGALQPRSAISSASPESSSHDSSSESSGRRKRKSPDSSSPSTFFGSHPSQKSRRNDGMMGGKMDVDTKARILSDPPHDTGKKRHNPDLDLNLQIINSEMQNNFDFKSAANSPKGFSSNVPLGISAGPNRHAPRSTSDQMIASVRTCPSLK